MQQHTTLTGRWSGLYDYPDGAAETTPFQAQIIDTDGQLSGDITEPNTFGITSAFTMIATLNGSRTGSDIDFIKEYIDSGDVHYFIRYSRTVNGTLTRIEGTWTTIEDGYSWSGPFIMTRLTAPEKEQHAQDEKDVHVLS